MKMEAGRGKSETQKKTRRVSCVHPRKQNPPGWDAYCFLCALWSEKEHVFFISNNPSSHLYIFSWFKKICYIFIKNIFLHFLELPCFLLFPLLCYYWLGKKWLDASREKAHCFLMRSGALCFTKKENFHLAFFLLRYFLKYIMYPLFRHTQDVFMYPERRTVSFSVRESNIDKVSIWEEIFSLSHKN